MMGGAAMLLFVCVFNIVSLLIFEERAAIVLYPILVFWLFVGIISAQNFMIVWAENRARLGLGLLASSLLLGPLAYASVVYLQHPLMVGLLTIAELISGILR
jgi:hypothetical protein